VNARLVSEVHAIAAAASRSSLGTLRAVYDEVVLGAPGQRAAAA
jgi:hypothetical protein